MKQVVVRVQRRVRMGMKDKLGLPYILSSSSGHMTIYLYLFGSLYFLMLQGMMEEKSKMY